MSRNGFPFEADLKTGRHRANQWLRNVRARRIRARRRGVSLRTLLMLLLGVLVLAATVSLGSIAYRTFRTTVERVAVREVGAIATFRKQALTRILAQQRARADALLKTAELGCTPDELWCLRKLLTDFVATEGVTAARLSYRGRAAVLAGKGAATLLSSTAVSSTAPLDGHTTRFEFDEQGELYYVLRSTSRDGKSTLAIRGDMQVANQVFLDRYGLGQSGETILTNDRGIFLTPARYPGQEDKPRTVNGEPLQMCLNAVDGEILAPGYRGVPVIYGFRHMPEIGGGCILALLDQAEAFAPTRSIGREVAGASALLAVLAIGCSFIFAQLVSGPMRRLTGRARSLQKGDFEGPVPVEGPSEIRMFAETFESMALSLKVSRSALQDATEHLRNVLEGISDGFAAFDRQWRCTYVNAKATDLSRIPRDESLGKNVWDLFPKSTGTNVHTELTRAMEQRVPVHLEEYYAPVDVWFGIDAYPTRDGLAVFGRDVTERKRFNERLQQSQKLESLGVLAGGIAHDFNNLLAGIMVNASILLDDLPSGDPARGGLEAVVKGAEQAASLTRQMLAYAGKGRFVVERLDLSERVRDIASLVRASIPKTVQLRLELTNDLPPVEADAAQLQQLVMNLIINAAESIDPGKSESVVITTRLEDVDQNQIDQIISSGEVLPGRYVTLEVRDPGCGMDEETQSRIFDPFFTTKFTGRGLGLAAVTGIVRGHKAALRVESAPGKGSSFKVLFPASQGKPARLQRSEQRKFLVGHGTILVIDDEESVRQAATTALENYGYKVVVAGNGKEGIELFQKLNSEISLVLLDMTMPVMSGEEALVRLQKIRPAVPVVLSSGYNEAEATRSFTGKGLAGFVQKPYTAAQLAEELQNALQGRRHHRRGAG